MPIVQVALEEGFEGDAVEVRVGDQVVQRDNVRTRTVIGLAELVDVSAPQGRCMLRVSLPGRGLATELPVDVGEDAHVRVNAGADGLTAVQVEQLGYA